MRKFNYGLFLAILFSALVWALIGVAVAKAAEYQDPRLDAVASSVAGHPITAHCYQGAGEWNATEVQSGLTFETDGFTFVGRDQYVNLAPRVCDTLEALLKLGPDAVGPFWAGLAIKVLIHESVHQRGITDEGVTDCAALALVKQYAVSSFGYAATVKQTVYRKLKNGTYRRTVRTVPNPQLAALYASALAWHRALPASYQGSC
jgi:hypothetical protein